MPHWGTPRHPVPLTAKLNARRIKRMVNSAVSVEGLRVVRGGREVVRDVSCRIAAGTVTGLLGPSGCGKTTLMRAIVGVQIVAGGTVTVFGRPAGSPALRRTIGYATQNPAIYPDLTVREALRYFASVLRFPPSDVDRVIAEVDLADHAGALIGRLSGGQRSRANLAVALLGTPELLILDEPTVGLDPVLRDELWALFGRLAARGATLLVSSHVMDEAARCDRLLLMREGRLLTDDTPGGLRERTGADDLERAFLHLITEEAAR
ncbi:ABC-2 type transport system ATP-binding protein [Prauserella muralis]|nr:ABC-2 type transport system ATP-binding protein [Prauserella muralis]